MKEILLFSCQWNPDVQLSRKSCSSALLFSCQGYPAVQLLRKSSSSSVKDVLLFSFPGNPAVQLSRKSCSSAVKEILLFSCQVNPVVQLFRKFSCSSVKEFLLFSFPGSTAVQLFRQSSGKPPRKFVGQLKHTWKSSKATGKTLPASLFFWQGHSLYPQAFFLYPPPSPPAAAEAFAFSLPLLGKLAKGKEIFAEEWYLCKETGEGRGGGRGLQRNNTEKEINKIDFDSFHLNYVFVLDIFYLLHIQTQGMLCICIFLSTVNISTGK